MEACLELRVLGCGHEFCQGCLVGIRARNPLLPCPLCRKETQVWLAAVRGEMSWGEMR